MKGHRDDEEAGASNTHREIERVVVLQPGGGKAQGDQVRSGGEGVKKVEPDSHR